MSTRKSTKAESSFVKTFRRFWAFPLFTNILMQRGLLVLMAALFIPAVYAGVVSVWGVTFAILTAIRFRAGLRHLCDMYDRGVTGFWRIHGHYLALILECAAYMAGANILFYINFLIFVDSWSPDIGTLFDHTVGYWRSFSSFVFIDTSLAYQSPSYFQMINIVIGGFYLVLAIVITSIRKFYFFDAVARKRKFDKAPAIGNPYMIISMCLTFVTFSFATLIYQIGVYDQSINHIIKLLICVFIPFILSHSLMGFIMTFIKTGDENE